MAGGSYMSAAEEIRSRANIVDVISPLVSIKKAGSNYTGCCPFHKEKTPSFIVFESGQHYHCFGCGAHGDVISFIMRYYDIGFLDNKAELFEEGEFTEEQKAEIKNHVHTGVDRLDFVLEKFRPIFVDAVCMHHENIDGSGYPDGIKNKRIPDIARMIHVVEAYIAMTSKRTYHSIVDSETALETLKNAPEKYDKDVVTILEDVI